MVELKKKRKRRKTKQKPNQVISQKVVVNVGNKGYSTRRRTGTQAKRSTQPQVIYQNAPIPLIPDYSSQLNDLRNEVRASRIASIAQPEQRTGIIAPKEKIEKIAKQEGVQGTDVQTEREVGRVMETMLGKLEIQERTEQIASGKIQKKKGRPAMSAEEKAARKESRELAKREALIRPVEGIPIPQEIQQVAELKPREFQEGSLLADIEGAVRLPQASRLKTRVQDRPDALGVPAMARSASAEMVEGSFV